MNYQVVIAAVEGVITLVWLVVFTTTAVLLSNRDCFGYVCSALRIATILGAFEWCVSAPHCASLVNRGENTDSILQDRICNLVFVLSYQFFAISPVIYLLSCLPETRKL